MAMTHQAFESRALGNAKDLYNQAKELIDAGGETAQIARRIDNLLVLAKLSAEIANAEALTVIAAAAERLTLPMLTAVAAEHQHLYDGDGELVATTDFTKAST